MKIRESIIEQRDKDRAQLEKKMIELPKNTLTYELFALRLALPNLRLIEALIDPFGKIRCRILVRKFNEKRPIKK